MQNSSFGQTSEKEGTPAPLQKSDPLPGQEAYLYTYVLFREKRDDGVLGLIKVCSTWATPQDAIADYKRVHDTNEQCQMKWGYTGKWEPLRYPETDTDGTVDVVKLPNEKLTEEDEFCGETVKKDVLKPSTKKLVKQDAAIRNYRDDKKVLKLEQKRKDLRKRLIDETQKEMDDPQTLASYAQLQHIRLAQKSALIEYEAKVLEAQTAYRKTLGELNNRRQKFPHYEDQWKTEIRRLTRIFDDRHAGNNVVDKPVAPLDYDLDETLANRKLEKIEDPFDSEIGIDAKAKQLVDDQIRAGHNGKGKEELNATPSQPLSKEKKEEVAKSFIPEEKTGKKKKKKNKGKNKK